MVAHACVSSSITVDAESVNDEKLAELPVWQFLFSLSFLLFRLMPWKCMGQGWGGDSARSALLPPLDDGHLAHKRGGGWWPLHDHVQPGLNYFHRQISTNLKNVLDAFKAARLFSPYKVHIMQPTVRAVDSLSIFPFLAQQESHIVWPQGRTSCLPSQVFGYWLGPVWHGMVEDELPQPSS